jgi:hypothetical protein
MKSFLRNLFAGCRTASTTRRSLRLEALEDRSVPTVTVTPLSGGELKIVGGYNSGTYDNRVEITQNDEANLLTIKGDGQTWNYYSNTVKLLTVNLGYGDDYFAWSQKGAMNHAKDAVIDLSSGNDWAYLFLHHGTIYADLGISVDMGAQADHFSASFGHISFASIGLGVDLGSGDDTGHVSLRGDFYGTASMGVNLDGKDGLDDLTVKVGDPFFGDGTCEIGSNADLFLGLYGYNHADDLEVTFDAEVDGHVDVYAYGMAGNDTLTGKINLKSGSFGSLSANFFGDADNDTLGCRLTRESSTGSSFSATIDGGTGTDIADMAITTFLVTKKNFEWYIY